MKCEFCRKRLATISVERNWNVFHKVRDSWELKDIWNDTEDHICYLYCPKCFEKEYEKEIESFERKIKKNKRR